MQNLKKYSEIVYNHASKLSDKWSSYLLVYDKVFAPYRDKRVSILEIGVQNGGSLECEAEYFHNAECIIGCDINEKCRELIYNKKNTHIVIGDANKTSIIQEIKNISSNFDIIIDDGSHVSSDIIHSFINYFPLLRNGGVYIVEDLHCSYWREYEGGLYDSTSAQSFFKLLVDIVNKEHWGIDKSRVQFINDYFSDSLIDRDEALLEGVYSVQFFNSMCVVYKSDIDYMGLGTRVVVGNNELITSNYKQHCGSGPYNLPQNHNPKSKFHKPFIIGSLMEIVKSKLFYTK